MKGVIFYLVALALLYLAAIIFFASGEEPQWLANMKTPAICALVGGLGATTYCLRAVYINHCVKDQWSDQWLAWYYIRPVVGVICGLAAWIFLEAGLLVLESSTTDNPTRFAFYALAFIAGLNIDRFLAKLEGVAASTWGIEKSRMAREGEEPEDPPPTNEEAKADDSARADG